MIRLPVYRHLRRFLLSLVSDLLQFYLSLSKGFFKDDVPRFCFLGQQQVQNLSPALAIFDIEGDKDWVE